MTLLEVIVNDLVINLGEHVSIIFGCTYASYIAMSWYFSNDLSLFFVNQRNLHITREYPQFLSFSDQASLFDVLTFNW